MREMIDATWRALAYCLHPVTLLWSLLPLGLMATAVFGLGWFWWEPSVAGVRGLLEQGDLLAALFEWLEAMGLPDWRPVLAPMILVALSLPALVMGTLAAGGLADGAGHGRPRGAAALSAAAAQPGGGRALGGAGLVAGVRAVRAAGAGAERAAVVRAAAGAGAAALIWGWLCYRVLAFDALARHAGTAERRFILHHHRWPLRLAGLMCGVLARCRRCCGPSGPWRWCWRPADAGGGGPTRWSSCLPACGSRIIRWPPAPLAAGRLGRVLCS
jgi:hypothetical protein